MGKVNVLLHICTLIQQIFTKCFLVTSSALSTLSSIQDVARRGAKACAKDSYGRLCARCCVCVLYACVCVLCMCVLYACVGNPYVLMDLEGRHWHWVSSCIDLHLT